MAAWPGWEAEFLNAANLPDTDANRQFLADWHAHANTDCGDNPIDLSEPVGNSTNCAALPGLTVKAQRYTSHADAAHAFTVQIHAGYSAALLAALESNNPYTVSDQGKVSEDLATWGSLTFARHYLNETGTVGGGAGGVKTLEPATLHGWSDVQRAVNVNLPRTLRQSRKSTLSALQSLRRARKVRI